MSATAKTARNLSARERLLNAAGVLFYNNGIHATGIDMIIAKAGVAKMSLYNNFASKADLVEAFIEYRHQEWLDLYAARLQQAHTPEEQILAVFDAYADHADYAYERGFRGCGLLNTAAELTAGEKGREAIRRHKEEIEQILQQHLRKIRTVSGGSLTAVTVDETAEHLAFLLEGAISRAGLEGDSQRVKNARRLAEKILAEKVLAAL